MSILGLNAENNGKTPRKVIGRPFPKGVSGNAGGRPKKSLMQREMERMANNPAYVKEWVEATKVRAKQAGVAGFLQSREILDRVDGPVKQEISAEITMTLASTIAERRKRAASDDSQS